MYPPWRLGRPDKVGTLGMAGAEPEPVPEEGLPPIPRNGVRNWRMIGRSRISSRTAVKRDNYTIYLICYLKRKYS